MEKPPPLTASSRGNRANPLAALWKNIPIANEVAQISADPAPGAYVEQTPEQLAAEMTVWTDHETGRRRTYFPPPDDFIGTEVGEFGDYNYERTLDPDEEEAFVAMREAGLAPLRRAGEAARRAFLALPGPANNAGADTRADARARPEIGERIAPAPAASRRRSVHRCSDAGMSVKNTPPA